MVHDTTQCSLLMLQGGGDLHGSIESQALYLTEAVTLASSCLARQHVVIEATLLPGGLEGLLRLQETIVRITGQKL